MLPDTREELDTPLEDVIASYLAADAAGTVPDRAEVLARHPALSTELAAFFADHDRMRLVASPVRRLLMATGLAVEPDAPPAPGRSFCGYELVEEIGRGGMGVVYKARHTALNRFVALKMIRAGALACAAELRRLRAEAEAVAALDHPHIVPLYEVGEHDGQPFFTMKLVEGTSLTPRVPDFVRDPHSAAGLMAALARAVQHAHERGILHRDLKPANVLLDAEGLPHLTDFGLARREGAGTGPTPSGVAVGTPAYMAPEQITLSAAAVTTAADIYSLGAVLYELLTGGPPFRGAGALDVLRQAVEAEPKRPRALNPAAPRDLETICLKCLAKDPARRYSTARALAEDLEAYLRGEPVRARPVGSLERLWRWCRRRPATAALSGSLLAAVAAGLVVAAVLWRQTEEHARRAEESATVADRERARAQADLAVADEAVRQFCLQLSREEFASGETRGVSPAVAREAVAYLERVVSQHGADPAPSRRLAEIHGLLHQLYCGLDRRAEALAACDRGLALYRQLLADAPQDVGLLLACAQLRCHRGLLQEERKQPAAAREDYDQSLALYETALRIQPEDPEGLYGLALTLQRQGQNARSRDGHDRAVALHRRAVRHLEEAARRQPAQGRYQRALAEAVVNLGVTLEDRKETRAEARTCFERARQTLQALAREQPRSESLRLALARVDRRLGRVMAEEKGKAGDAEAALLRAVAEGERAVARSGDGSARETLAASYNYLGSFYASRRQPAKALGSFSLARAQWDRLARARPGGLDVKVRLARVLFNLGVMHGELGQRREAQLAYEQGRDSYVAAVKARPDDAGHRAGLARVLNNLGLVQLQLGRPDTAARNLHQGVEQMREALRLVPDHPEARRVVNALFLNLGHAERAAGRPAEAVKVALQWRPLCAGDPKALFQVARDLALAARAVGPDAARQAERRRYAGLAVEVLRQARGCGFRDADRLRREPAFQILADDADFAQLLAELARPAPKR
jgi:tetratricopeptide (TPR) repeat protein/tRNA A-37 threonylcarbamoyl transferase component Bud32